MNQNLEAIEAAQPLEMSGKIRVFIPVALLVALGLFVYGGTLWGLVMSVLHREGSSHGVFVPFISGFFFWLKRKKIRTAEPHFAPVPGIMMVAAGLVMCWVVRDNTEVALPALSFLLVAAGLVLAFFGVDVFRELSFPLFFLGTMIPLPKPLYAEISEWMRAAVTSGSVWVLQLFHFPIYREAYTVHLPNMNLLVAHSCSGIRYLLSFFVFGLAYAFFFKQGIKSRTLVVLATIPLSIIGGVLRLSTIFLSVYLIGPFMAWHRPHVLLSWSVFLALLAGAVCVDRALRHWAERIGHGAKSMER